MDAVLISSDGETILFVESKFTETFSSQSWDRVMPESYYLPEKYFMNFNEKWIPFLNNIKLNKTMLLKNGKYLDLKQDLCHCIGIYNFVNRYNIFGEKYDDFKKWDFLNTDGCLSKVDLRNISNYNFMNLEYEPDKSEYSELFERYDLAEKDGLKFGEEIRPDIFNGVPFNYYFYSYKDFANECLPDGDHKKLFMKKYLIKKTEGE